MHVIFSDFRYFDLEANNSLNTNVDKAYYKAGMANMLIATF